MERYTLNWINETQLVEAGDTHVNIYYREGQILASQPEGAKLMTPHPVTNAVRYLAKPSCRLPQFRTAVK